MTKTADTVTVHCRVAVLLMPGGVRLVRGPNDIQRDTYERLLDAGHIGTEFEAGARVYLNAGSDTRAMQWQAAKAFVLESDDVDVLTMIQHRDHRPSVREAARERLCAILSDDEGEDA